METFKECLRTIIWPFAVMCGGDIYVKGGTLMCRLFTWLYGEGERQEIYEDD